MQHIRSIRYLIITVIIILISCSSINDIAGTISETDGGLIGIHGTVVTSNGIPQKDVSITLFRENNDGLIDTVANTSTNEKGLYLFPSISSGTYTIGGIRNIDSLTYTLLVNDIEYDSVAWAKTGYDVGTDTLVAPGTLTGSVSLESAGNPEGILVYIPGTPYQAHSDSNGTFTIPGIAEDSGYSLVYTYDGYLNGYNTNIEITSSDTTVAPHKELLVDPETVPLAPVDLTAQFDTNTNIVTITWEAVNHPYLAGYHIYKKDSLHEFSQPIQLNSSELINKNDTVWNDTITNLKPGESVNWQYQIKSQHSKGDLSSFSWPVYVTVTESLLLPPSGVTAVYDSISKIVTIRWDSVAHPNIAGYKIFRTEKTDEQSDTITISSLLSASNSTLIFYDTLTYLPVDDTITYYYFMKSVHSLNVSSSFSSPETVTIVIPDRPFPIPVAHWPLDGNAQDITGKNSGRFLSLPTDTTNRFGENGKAVYFDKSNDIIVEEDSSLAFTGSFSISLWYNKDSHDPSDRDFLIFRGVPGSGYDSYFLSLEKQAVWKFHIEDSSGIDNDLTVPIASEQFGKWVHLAAVFNTDTRTMELFFDGVSAGTRSTSIIPIGSTPGIEQNIRIGGYFAKGFGINGETGLWKGGLDDVILFNQALTQKEIRLLANK